VIAVNLKALLPAGSNINLFAHLMQWFEPGNSHSTNTGVTYDSSDLRTIAQQIQLAKDAGIDGFLVDWYGPASVNSFGDTAFLNLLQIAEILGGFRAGICIDKGAVKNLMAANAGMTTQEAFQTAYNYVTSIYAAYPAFFGDYILEFGCGALGVSFGGFQTPSVLHDDPTYGQFFTWVDPPQGASQVAKNYTNPDCVMGSVCWGFNDGAPANLNDSVWGGPVRLLDRCHLGTNWKQCWANIPVSMKYVQIVTWNDYEEGTGIEGVLGMGQ
jgi:hypothetical protein